MEEIKSLYFLTFAQRKSKSKVKLNFGLSTDFSVQLKVSLIESLSKRLSQKLKWPTGHIQDRSTDIQISVYQTATCCPSQQATQCSPVVSSAQPFLVSVRPNNAICQHFQTTPQDLSVFLHCCHWLTNRIIHHCDSNAVWHITRCKCCSLTFRSVSAAKHLSWVFLRPFFLTFLAGWRSSMSQACSLSSDARLGHVGWY